METESLPKEYKSYNEVLRQNYSEKYFSDGVEASLTRNNHMNNYDGEPCAEAARTVVADLLAAAQFPEISQRAKTVDILEQLTTAACSVRKTQYNLKQTTTDAILVDFINYVGVLACVDYALYTKDLDTHLQKRGL